MRAMSIEGENYERSITPVRSDISRFSRGTVGGSGSDEDERLFPSSPGPSQYNPEQFVRCSEPSARSLGVESEELLTQGEILQDEVLARTEGTNNPAEHVPEPQNHDQNFSEMSPTDVIPKSLILQVYDVLMNDRRKNKVVSSAPCSNRRTVRFLVLITAMTIARKINSRQPARSSEGP